jgi:hypothetical protein
MLQRNSAQDSIRDLLLFENRRDFHRRFEDAHAERVASNLE